MTEKTELNVSAIFVGLTRPPMMFGVTLDYLFICFLCSYGMFMLTSNPAFLIVIFPTYAFGWIACRMDPNIFRVFLKKTECPAVRNKKIWGCQSYEPF